MSIFDTSDTITTEEEVSVETCNQPTLRDSVQHAIEQYFKQLDGQEPSELYDMVLAEVEAPLLTSVMKHTRGNQTKAAKVLGLNRGTLRKKLKIYGMN